MAREYDLPTLSTSREFMDCWYRLVDSPVSYGEFKTWPMPKGVSPRDLWFFFARLRRGAGIVFKVRPWFPAEKDISWMYIPKSTESELRQIVGMSAPGSQLNEYLQDRGVEESGFLPFLFEEVESLCRRDGINLSMRTIRGLWLGYCEPRSSVEKVIINMSIIFSQMDRLSGRKITIGTIEYIHELLLDGIDELPHLQRVPHFRESILSSDRLADREFILKMLGAAITELDSNDVYIHPIIAATEMAHSLWDLGYFSDLNALTEIVVRHIFFHQTGLPVLAFVPYSSLCENHEVAALIDTFMDDYEQTTAEIGSAEGLDCTLLYTGSIHVYLEGVKRISASVSDIGKDEDRVREKLESIPGLNKRQRQFLVLISRSSSKSYKIQDYIDKFGVAYGTANKDLFGLVELGLLTYRHVGKAFVFQKAPGSF